MIASAFMKRIIHAGFFLFLFVSWFGLLWWLSSRAVTMPGGPEITHIDKVYHFGFFFGGSGLFCAFLYRLFDNQPDWGQLLWITMIVMTAIGAIDEWHQSLHPARSGNDAMDLCADVLGSLAGYRVFRWLHRWLDGPDDTQSS
jgi:VanZ family protein